MQEKKKKNAELANEQIIKMKQALLLTRSALAKDAIAENPDDFNFSMKKTSIRVDLGKALKGFKGS